MRDQDFEGLRSRDLESSALDDMRLAESILNRIDKGERPTSAEMIFMRWYCGLSLNEPRDFRQIEMSVISEGE